MEKNIGQAYHDEVICWGDAEARNAIEILVGMKITRVHYNPITRAIQAMITTDMRGNLHILSFQAGVPSRLILDGKTIGEVS
jgi:hypothetical protein